MALRWPPSGRRRGLPVFHQGRFVGFAGNIANTSDIGGSLDAKTVRDSYEEGIFFPICKLYDGGDPNELVFDMFRWNVRAPEMVLTDIEAQVAANAVGMRRVVDLLSEYGLEDLSALSQAIRERSGSAMRQAIAGIPDGEYASEVFTDGMGDPLKIAVKITVRGEEIEVDYAGSSPQLDVGGLNCTLIYSTGHTLYPLACLLTAQVPVNEGCFEPITVRAPEGRSAIPRMTFMGIRISWLMLARNSDFTREASIALACLMQLLIGFF